MPLREAIKRMKKQLVFKDIDAPVGKETKRLCDHRRTLCILKDRGGL